ncbi:MAG: hypothetical protein LBJ36_02645 [Synergistaceae bacterium]|jgi:hypothetical protein|nr:hypothetical protein [Synergistaceae bacterium]
MYEGNKELSGKTGAEKKKAAVAKMSELIDLPYVPEWLEDLIEPALYGVAIDAVCNLFNILTNHSFKNVQLTSEQATKAVALTEAEPFLPHESALPDDVLESMTATGT